MAKLKRWNILFYFTRQEWEWHVEIYLFPKIFFPKSILGSSFGVLKKSKGVGIFPCLFSFSSPKRKNHAFQDFSSCSVFLYGESSNGSSCSYLASLFLRKLPYAALNRHLRKMLTVRPLLKLTHAALWYFTLYDSPMQLPLELPLKNITDSCKERLQHLNKSFCTLNLIAAQ